MQKHITFLVRGFVLEGFLMCFCCVKIHMSSGTGLICGTTGSSASQLGLQLTAQEVQLKPLIHTPLDQVEHVGHA